MTFKVYGPTQNPEHAPPGPKSRRKSPEPDLIEGIEGIPGTGSFSIKQEKPNEPFEAVVVSPATLAPSKFKPKPKSKSQINFCFQEPARRVPNSIHGKEERYFTHFIDRVSTLLIIYDSPINTNPYRRHFPDFARSSPSMVGAMEALGALHLANTSVGAQRNSHFQQAMSKYGEVVQLFRARYARPSQELGMTDFATCLLLCLFEVR